MLALVLLMAAVNPVPEAAHLAAVRKQFGEPHLPAGCRAEVISGDGLRLTAPAGQWHGILFWANHRRSMPSVELREIEGDFEATARLRLRLDRRAGAAGVTEVVQTEQGPVAKAIPTVQAGLYVDGGERAFAAIGASAVRTGDKNLLCTSIQASSAGGGIGGGYDVAEDYEPAVRVILRRVGESVRFAGGAADRPDGEWEKPAEQRVTLPRRVGLRLFATGNLDQPFAVEFDQLRITPLPAAAKK